MGGQLLQPSMDAAACPVQNVLIVFDDRNAWYNGNKGRGAKAEPGMVAESCIVSLDFNLDLPHWKPLWKDESEKERRIRCGRTKARRNVGGWFFWTCLRRTKTINTRKTVAG